MGTLLRLWAAKGGWVGNSSYYLPWHVTPNGREEKRMDGERQTTQERGHEGGERVAAICHPCAAGGSPGWEGGQVGAPSMGAPSCRVWRVQLQVKA